MCIRDSEEGVVLLIPTLEDEEVLVEEGVVLHEVQGDALLVLQVVVLLIPILAEAEVLEQEVLVALHEEAVLHEEEVLVEAPQLVALQQQEVLEEEGL